MDVYGHGTHVSGTIGATSDGKGVVGVAWNVKILPVRFLGDDGGGTLEGAVKSIDYATTMHANIMSNSWGGGGFSQALLDAITRAKDAGILFVAAAGNRSNDNDSNPEYPCGYQVDNVISVAAIDPRGLLADFSNYGKTTVHIAAPGVNIFSYTMAGLESWSGTSMATPHVSGVAALLYAQDPTQSYLTVKTRLMNSARPLPMLRGRVMTGLVNAYYALTNQVAPIDPDDPFNWLKSMDTVSTDHPYKDKTKVSYTFTVPGARRVAAYFTNFDTESGYDQVSFTDANGKSYGELSGKLGEAYGPVIDGDTVIITFTSDDSVNAYGFDLSGIAYQN
jgi:subtilisin family serine protease